MLKGLKEIMKKGTKRTQVNDVLSNREYEQREINDFFKKVSE